MIRLLVLLSILIASSCGGGQKQGADPQPCTEEWRRYVEEQVQTGDSEGHGPDVGSTEWQSVVEFKLGIRGNPEVPSRDTDEWCGHIDDKLRESGT